MSAGTLKTPGGPAIVILAALFVLTAGGCANFLLLHPTGRSMRPPGIERRIVTREEGDLEVWVARSPGADTLPIETSVLVFSGNADRAERLATAVARLLGERAALVWAVNYPGYGGSEGSASLDAIPGAALAAYDALTAQTPDLPVVCWGESLGTTAALAVGAERDVAGLVLRNPPPLRRLIMARHGWWNLWLVAIPVALQVPIALNALDSAPRVTAPAVFVMSRDDRVVPYDYQRLVFEAFAGPKQEVILAHGHNDGMDRDEKRRLDDALSRLFDQLP